MAEYCSDSDSVLCTPPQVHTPDGCFCTPERDDQLSDQPSDHPEFSHSDSNDVEDVVDLCDSDTENQPKLKGRKITDFFKPQSQYTGKDIRSFGVSQHRSRPKNPSKQSTGSTAVITAPAKSKGKRSNVYTTYTLGKKFEVLEYINAGHMDADAGRHFGIARTTIRSWKGMECEPKQRIASKLKGKHAKKGSGRPLLYSVSQEDQLVQWILESRSLQLPKQSKTIQRKAMALIQPTNPEFRASDGWL
jgi:hypothetical protein